MILEEPLNKKIWIIHGLSEFIGTILISLGLAGLSTVVGSNNNGGTFVVESYFGHEVLVAFYAGFIIVGFILVIFLRWSCDLNPAVTLYRWLSGQNTSRYAIYKISIQFIAAIIAGSMIYGFGSARSIMYSGTDDIVANHAISLNGIKGALIGSREMSDAERSLIIFAAELVMTMILLFSIFSKSINDKYRDLMIMFVISLTVLMGLITGTAAINPARGLAQQIPGLFWGHHAGNASSLSQIGYATISMELGTLIAPAIYIMIQGITTEYINPFVNRGIQYKNNKKDNMKTTK